MANGDQDHWLVKYLKRSFSEVKKRRKDMTDLEEGQLLQCCECFWNYLVVDFFFTEEMNYSAENKPL